MTPEQEKFFLRYTSTARIIDELTSHLIIWYGLFEITRIKGLPVNLSIHFMKNHTSHLSNIVIDICKLYDNDDRNQEYNLFKLLRIIEHNLEDDKLKRQFSKYNVSDYLSKIKMQQNRIQTFVTMRDQIFAHTHKGSPGYGIQYKSIKPLVELANEIMDSIYAAIENPHLSVQRTQLNQQTESGIQMLKEVLEKEYSK